MLFTILGSLVGLAGPLLSWANKLTDLKAAQVAAKTETEKAYIQQQIEEAHDRKAVITAEIQNRFGATVRTTMQALLAIGPITYIMKVFLWDKVVGSFKGCVGDTSALEYCKLYETDSLRDPNLWWVAMAVVTLYTMYDIASRTMRK